MNEQTLADVAVKQANMETNLIAKAVYTGRMLVKRTYEDAEMPSPIDPVEISQYLTPELRSWAQPLFRLLLKGSDHTPLKRAMVIRDMAKNQPDTISIFDRAGKVEL